MNGKREYGDYQTPVEFTEKVCMYIKEVCHINPTAIIEPTCGVGHFLKSSLLFDANEYYGIEINKEYCDICKKEINNDKVKIINSDFFSFSTKSLIKDSRQILIIGNPPWITNSTLSTLNSKNLPLKTNFKKEKGINAITGRGNFDICESIILQIINEYKNTNAFITMLCKTSVARNIFKELKRNYINFKLCKILEFDAVKVFDISASACVLLIHLSEKEDTLDFCNIYDFENSEVLKSQIKFSDGNFYNKKDTDIENFDGVCCFEWRQGVKHDCSKIMELSLQNGNLQNGRNEIIQIENDIVFPLIKSSMFKSPIIHDFSKYVIVTQKKVREETKYIKTELPKTWKYLNDNIMLFENRKSSIYNNAPLFSMFGIGKYSYSKYKVGVSGFYKKPLFSVLYSDDGKPVMTDDTSYFICFDKFDTAYIAMLILNSEKVQKFLTNLVFLDDKRPYTKKILGRIDFSKIVKVLTINELSETEKNLKLSMRVNNKMYDDFKSLLNYGQLEIDYKSNTKIS